jgi:hypothetical protein
VVGRFYLAEIAPLALSIAAGHSPNEQGQGAGNRKSASHSAPKSHGSDRRVASVLKVATSWRGTVKVAPGVKVRVKHSVIRSERNPHTVSTRLLLLSQCAHNHSLEVAKAGSDLMGVNPPFVFKKGPKRSKWGTRRLWEFCGS